MFSNKLYLDLKELGAIMKGEYCKNKTLVTFNMFSFKIYHHLIKLFIQTRYFS